MVADAFSAKAAGAIKPVLEGRASLRRLSQVFAIVYPYIEMAFTRLAVWEKLQPYHLQEFMFAIAASSSSSSAATSSPSPRRWRPTAWSASTTPRPR